MLDITAKASASQEIWSVRRPVLILARSDCPDPWVSTGPREDEAEEERRLRQSPGARRVRSGLLMTIDDVTIHTLTTLIRIFWALGSENRTQSLLCFALL